MKKISLAFVFLIGLMTAFAQNVEKKHYNHDNNLMVDGYDVVAYFTKNKAVEGSSKFKYVHKGMIYHFSSQNNLNLFKANPNKYIPQYGGWCAYALGAKEDKVSINPETFKVVNGKLYLFYNQFWVNTLDSWNEDEANLNRKADACWKKLIAR